MKIWHKARFKLFSVEEGFQCVLSSAMDAIETTRQADIRLMTKTSHKVNVGKSINLQVVLSDILHFSFHTRCNSLKVGRWNEEN